MLRLRRDVPRPTGHQVLELTNEICDLKETTARCGGRNYYEVQTFVLSAPFTRKAIDGGRLPDHPNVNNCSDPQDFDVRCGMCI
jgi:hypothetical protein